MSKEITIRGATYEGAREIISDIGAGIIREGDKAKVYLSDGQIVTYKFKSTQT